MFALRAVSLTAVRMNLTCHE